MRIATILHLMNIFNNGLRQLKCLNNKGCWECYAWTPCNNDGNWYLRPSSNQHCSWVSHWHDDLFRENPPNERTIWEHQSSMKLERKLGINKKEERKRIGWTLELKKKRPLLLLRFFSFPQRRTRSAEHESEFTEGGDTRDNRVTNC